MLTDLVVVAYDFLSGRMEGGPVGILREREGVEGCRDITIIRQLRWTRNAVRQANGIVWPYFDLERSPLAGEYEIEEKDDLPSYARVAIDPPGSSNTRLAVEYAELVEAKLLLQLARHSNA